MTHVLTVARRDLGAYLHGYAAYVVIAGILFVEGLLFNAFALGAESARYSHEVLEQFFYINGGAAMVASVLLTMRSLAEEQATGTDVLLRTSVAGDGQVVLGKYLAAMGMLTLLTLLTFYMPLLIFVNGKVSLSHLAVGYLGVLGLGSATTAMGIFGSSLFRSQMAAGIFSGILVVTFLTAWMLSEIVDPPFAEVTAYAALFNQHFVPFQEGRLMTSGLVYYGSITALFLTLSAKVLEGRRWE